MVVNVSANTDSRCVRRSTATRTSNLPTHSTTPRLLPPAPSGGPGATWVRLGGWRPTDRPSRAGVASCAFNLSVGVHAWVVPMVHFAKLARSLLNIPYARNEASALLANNASQPAMSSMVALFSSMRLAYIAQVGQRSRASRYLYIRCLLQALRLCLTFVRRRDWEPSTCAFKRSRTSSRLRRPCVATHPLPLSMAVWDSCILGSNTSASRSCGCRTDT